MSKRRRVFFVKIGLDGLRGQFSEAVPFTFHIALVVATSGLGQGV